MPNAPIQSPDYQIIQLPDSVSPQPAVLQPHELVGIRRFVSSGTRVIDEARRDSVIAQPDDLLQRQILQSDPIANRPSVEGASDSIFSSASCTNFLSLTT